MFTPLAEKLGLRQSAFHVYSVDDFRTFLKVFQLDSHLISTLNQVVLCDEPAKIYFMMAFYKGMTNYRKTQKCFMLSYGASLLSILTSNISQYKTNSKTRDLL